MKLAESSSFAGERSAALAAAERLAERCGMSLDEAASGAAAPPQPPDPIEAQNQAAAAAWANAVHLMDQQIYREKLRRDEALRAARSRGLDAEQETRRRSPSASPRSRRRLDPDRHAWALVHETELSYREIARITGLDVYTVVAMKIAHLRSKQVRADRQRRERA